jgi:uncharacterized protein YndB with AHSA1/START domain
MTDPTNATDIRIVRIYDAPLSMVWDAWTDLRHVAQWWGPRGFTITTHAKELRPGGSWEYTMHGPDGVDWPNFTRYLEVVPQALLVYDHGATSSDSAPMFRVTARFRDLGGRTELDLCMTLPSAEAARNARTFIKAAGGNGTWDRLAEFLESRVSSREIFVINRSFDAPRATVFDMWVSPEKLPAWLPPAGFTMTSAHADVRSGGELRFSMTNGAFTMHARHRYLRVEPTDRLEYLQSFTDAEWNVSRQPGSPMWPETTRVVVEFADEEETQTRVTVRFDIEGEATAAEVAAFVAERGGMARGWSQSFDVLDERLNADVLR